MLKIWQEKIVILIIISFIFTGNAYSLDMLRVPVGRSNGRVGKVFKELARNEAVLVSDFISDCETIARQILSQDEKDLFGSIKLTKKGIVFIAQDSERPLLIKQWRSLTKPNEIGLGAFIEAALKDIIEKEGEITIPLDREHRNMENIANILHSTAGRSNKIKLVVNEDEEISSLALANNQTTGSSSRDAEGEKLEGFDARLNDGDTTVISDIKTYYENLPKDNSVRQEIYEWLQFHRAPLTADVLGEIGSINWASVVSKLVGVINGTRVGNPISARQQLRELVEKGTYGGLQAPEDAVGEAKRVWESDEAFREPISDFIPPQRPQLIAKKPGVLVLVRHGETNRSESVTNKWAGWFQSLITPKGRKEAKEAGERLKVSGLKFDRAYASDLSRSQETLKEVLSALGQENIPITIAKEIRERNYGDLIGWRRALVEKVFGRDQFLNWRRGHKGYS